MKNQRTDALMTEILLTEIVLESVFNRWGAWFTHLPTMEEKHIDARVPTMPLKETASVEHYHVT